MKQLLIGLATSAAVITAAYCPLHQTASAGELGKGHLQLAQIGGTGGGSSSTGGSSVGGGVTGPSTSTGPTMPVVRSPTAPVLNNPQSPQPGQAAPPGQSGNPVPAPSTTVTPAPAGAVPAAGLNQPGAPGTNTVGAKPAGTNTLGTTNLGQALNANQRMQLRSSILAEVPGNSLGNADPHLSVGSTLPTSAQLETMPSSVASIAPNYATFKFTTSSNGTIYVVDPTTYRVVDIIGGS